MGCAVLWFQQLAAVWGIPFTTVFIVTKIRTAPPLFSLLLTAARVKNTLKSGIRVAQAGICVFYSLVIWPLVCYSLVTWPPQAFSPLWVSLAIAVAYYLASSVVTAALQMPSSGAVSTSTAKTTTELALCGAVPLSVCLSMQSAALVSSECGSAKAGSASSPRMARHSSCSQ